MAAQASTQPIETKSNLIDKPRERVRDFIDLCDITILPLIAVNFEIALSPGIIVIKKARVAFHVQSFTEMPRKQSGLTFHKRCRGGSELQRSEADVDDLDHVDPGLRYRRVQHGGAIRRVDCLQRQS
jgi:hypothetical protein